MTLKAKGETPASNFEGESRGPRPAIAFGRKPISGTIGRYGIPDRFDSGPNEDELKIAPPLPKIAGARRRREDIFSGELARIVGEAFEDRDISGKHTLTLARGGKKKAPEPITMEDL